jgi:hypothetical protein
MSVVGERARYRGPAVVDAFHPAIPAVPGYLPTAPTPPAGTTTESSSRRTAFWHVQRNQACASNHYRSIEAPGLAAALPW